MDEIVFTTPALLDFLSQIDELGPYPLELHEDDNNIQIVIVDSVYNINSNHADQIQVKLTLYKKYLTLQIPLVKPYLILTTA